MWSKSTTMFKRQYVHLWRVYRIKLNFHLNSGYQKRQFKMESNNKPNTNKHLGKRIPRKRLRRFSESQREGKIETKNEYWTLTRELIDSSYFSRLLPQFMGLCKPYTIKIYNKVIWVKKISCTFSYKKETRKSIVTGISYYNEIPSYSWNEAPKELIEIKNKIESYYGVSPDFVLVHIYRDRHDYIGFHKDREAMDSEIMSVSLGASRRFQFRPNKEKKGYSHEYLLKSGDVVYMHGPRDNKKSCQYNFKHTLPKMTAKDLKKHIEENGMKFKGRFTFKNLDKFIENNNISPVRINLTFRQYNNKGKADKRQ